VARRTRPDDATLDAWQAWLRAHRLLAGTLDRELRASGEMTLDDYDVLVQLAQAPGRRMRMSDLAAALLLARSSCTRIVDRLEERGWVQRRHDDADGRVLWAFLTVDGRDALRRAAVVHLAGVQQHFGRHLDEREVAVLGESARRIVEAAQSGRASTDTLEV
jgi:DNA-binding MarR family transcriptional regulator